MKIATGIATMLMLLFIGTAPVSFASFVRKRTIESGGVIKNPP